jgi:hypothetical protein
MRQVIVLKQDTCRNRATTRQQSGVITAEAKEEDPTGCARIGGGFDASCCQALQ